ncbi:MAG: hypothetical protein A3F73_04115 [Gallionellales bacterium RIFCSPLOWO2_12_FULL_59_22]|nr:MAG: hypothetical protein A3H99_01250 [Gallionellales bacterium RIFCSPLOWO2_02_FULL_59_110]OGT03645.1 MAG: hypothetical protein A2Z65_07225 [Gallionellales bacterium RIFCSPLOWO2_02_58_13]OGT14009.1 MAG: hypothetical protein A3F73_04115 [Gallionellales bacterium RIFCSPLOWO2_12_FULL_59_22]
MMKTILLVEGDATNRKLVRVVLGDKKRYRILEAANAGEAMEQLGSMKPDLLLLDIRLDEGNGMEVIRVARSDRPCDEVPAVAITAEAMKNDEKRFLAAGFDGYLSKPVDIRRLQEMVERFINEGRKAAYA